MSELKFSLNKNDFIAEKTNPKDIHFVIKIDLHRVYLRRESDDEIFSVQKRLVNFAWTKINPEVAKVLYEEMQRVDDQETQKINSQRDDSKAEG